MTPRARRRLVLVLVLLGVPLVLLAALLLALGLGLADRRVERAWQGPGRLAVSGVRLAGSDRASVQRILLSNDAATLLAIDGLRLRGGLLPLRLEHLDLARVSVVLDRRTLPLAEDLGRWLAARPRGEGPAPSLCINALALQLADLELPPIAVALVGDGRTCSASGANLHAGLILSASGAVQRLSVDWRAVPVAALAAAVADLDVPLPVPASLLPATAHLRVTAEAAGETLAWNLDLSIDDDHLGLRNITAAWTGGLDGGEGRLELTGTDLHLHARLSGSNGRWQIQELSGRIGPVAQTRLLAQAGLTRSAQLPTTIVLSGEGHIAGRQQAAALTLTAEPAVPGLRAVVVSMAADERQLRAEPLIHWEGGDCRLSATMAAQAPWDWQARMVGGQVPVTWLRERFAPELHGQWLRLLPDWASIDLDLGGRGSQGSGRLAARSSLLNLDSELSATRNGGGIVLASRAGRVQHLLLGTVDGLAATGQTDTVQVSWTAITPPTWLPEDWAATARLLTTALPAGTAELGRGDGAPRVTATLTGPRARCRLALTAGSVAVDLRDLPLDGLALGGPRWQSGSLSLQASGRPDAVTSLAATASLLTPRVVLGEETLAVPGIDATWQGEVGLAAAIAGVGGRLRLLPQANAWQARIDRLDLAALATVLQWNGGLRQHILPPASWELLGHLDAVLDTDAAWSQLHLRQLRLQHFGVAGIVRDGDLSLTGSATRGSGWGIDLAGSLAAGFLRTATRELDLAQGTPALTARFTGDAAESRGRLSLAGRTGPHESALLLDGGLGNDQARLALHGRNLDAAWLGLLPPGLRPGREHRIDGPVQAELLLRHRVGSHPILSGILTAVGMDIDIDHQAVRIEGASGRIPIPPHAIIREAGGWTTRPVDSPESP
jgi:hypothetical protein